MTQPPGAGLGAIRTLARCGACGGKVPVEPGQECLNCPLCGLTLLRVPGEDELHPMAVPRADREACWKSLAAELALPEAAEATQVRSARLLLVPYWRLEDESKRSVSRPGLVVSAADLTPVGVPPLTAGRRKVRGLSVEEGTRTGDSMGRLPAGAPSPAATPVEVMCPAGAIPAGSDPGARWRLVYYPIWAFRYVVYDKEEFHAVDAVNGTPIGPARRVSWLTALAIATSAMLAVYAAAVFFTGAAAAIPAWAAGLIAMRAAIRWQRG